VSKTVTSRFVLKGDNQLNSSFAKAKRQLAAVGKAAGIAGVALGAMVARSVIKNTIEQEKAVAQLNAALKSTGRFTPEASQALQDHAAALQQVSTFGDEAVIKAQNLLLTFRNIGGEAFPRATQAVLDTATAMGTDLKSAAIQLGKALNDPKTQLTALSRSGITFSEAQKEMIFAMVDANDTAGAQAIILKELEVQFGGSAKAARETLGGALDAVKNNFGDLLEVTGTGKDGITGSLNELAAILADPDVKSGFQDLAVGALDLLEVIVQLPGTIGFLKDELGALFGVIDNDDVVRLSDQMADLQVELKGAEEAAAGWIGKLLGGDQAAEEVARINEEIRITQNLLDEIEAKATDKKPNQTDVAGRVSDALPGSTGGDTGAGADSDSQKLIEKLQFETSLIGLSNTAKEQAIALRNLEGVATAEEAAQIEQLIAVKNTLNEVDTAKLELITVTAEKTQVQLSAGAELISQLQFEQSLIGLTNAEREIAIQLRGIETDATIAQIEKARELIVQNQELAASEAQRGAAMGIFSNAANGFLSDMENGTKSAKEAFADMAKAIIADMARIIIQQAIMAAFGQGAGVGGGFSLAGVFGGGRAIGGPVTAGVPYLVGERGPELIVPRNSGTVIPNSKLSSGQTVNNNFTINLPAQIARTTPAQMASTISREQKRAVSRNR